MPPEPSQPKKPPASAPSPGSAPAPARRLSDKTSATGFDPASHLPAGSKRSPLDAAAAAPRRVSTPTTLALTHGSAPGQAGTPVAGLPLVWVVPILASVAALVATGAALLLTDGLGWSAAAAAVGAALVALGVAALSAVALTRRWMSASGHAVVDATGLGCGVASKAQFLDLIEREWSRARRYGTGAALLLIDVDRHARLADTRGAAVLDAVLAELARQTAPTLRGADAIARFGPSQLAVFLAHADPTGALDVAERIRERAEALQIDPDGEPLRLTVSLGVAPLRPAHLHMQALVHDAEDAVFAARQAGGNCVRSAPVNTTSRPSDNWHSDNRTKP